MALSKYPLAEVPTPIRWLTVLNLDTFAVPPFAVLEVVDVDEEARLTVQRPSASNRTDVIFNGACQIPAGSEGQAHQSYPAIVAFEQGSGAENPAAGDVTWGVAAGSYYLTAGQSGFRVLGGTDDTFKLTNVLPSTPGASTATFTLRLRDGATSDTITGNGTITIKGSGGSTVTRSGTGGNDTFTINSSSSSTFSGAHYTDFTTVPLTPDTPTVINFDSQDYDTDGYCVSGVFVMPFDGVYRLAANASTWSGGDLGTYRTITIQGPAGVIIAAQGSGADVVPLSCGGDCALGASDTVTLYGLTDGTDCNVQGSWSISRLGVLP